MPRKTKPWHGKTDNSPVPPRVKIRVKSRANNCCEICGARIRYGGIVDHTVAIILGGDNAEHNLRLLCRTCERPKTASDVKQKASEARTQKHMAGFKSKGRSFNRPKRERSTLPLRVAWIDENGRDRVTWLKPTPSDADGTT